MRRLVRLSARDPSVTTFKKRPATRGRMDGKETGSALIGQILARERKWQGEWAKARLFEADPDAREKFFCTFPYPYVNGLPHVGHLFTIMRVEALARYRRLQGKNVLFPQAWHATGSPIATAARRVAEGDEKQIKILKDMGVTDAEIGDFARPEHWIAYFVPRYKEDLSAVGLSIDWRREFHTTSLNPHYDAFIRWQFAILKEKGYVQQGEHPVVWCPKDNAPVGDHDRKEGEGETPKEFLWGKFRLRGSDLILMAGTTRPDAFLGQTNMWVDPKATYAIVAVGDEKWVVGKKAIAKILEQHAQAEQIGEIPASELVGKWVKGPAVDYEICVVPARFIDASVGSGIVYSALEDPVDLLEIRTLQSDPARIAEHGLDPEIVARLRPIPIIEVPGMGADLGDDIMREYGISSYKDRKKVEEAKGELNRRVFRKGVMRGNCGKYAGMPVPDAQREIIKDTIAAGDAAMFYELTGRVVCRCQTESIVKVVSDQWFLTYSDPEWKRQARDALAQVALYPEKVRAQFDHVLGWLGDWACTREYGLGTRLPWDERWLIESLSDSTVYMAYYTIAHRIKEIPPASLTREFFDYVFLGKGEKPALLGGADAGALREEFGYWYPLDFRNSGKDLVQNHLSFMLFNHCAIFPKAQWPRGIGVNGWVTVNGQKMSKSLGNVIPVRALLAQFGADATRITILNGGEGLDDPNWDSDFARAIAGKLDMLIRQAGDAAQATGGPTPMDAWLRSRTHAIMRDVTAAMERTDFRTAIQLALFEYSAAMRWYAQRTLGGPDARLLRDALRAQLTMLSPFVPHACEEAWRALGEGGFASAARWPESDASLIDDDEDLAEELVREVAESLRKGAQKGRIAKATLYLAADWKREAYARFDDIAQRTRNPDEISRTLALTPLGGYGDELGKLVRYLAKGRTPGRVLSADEERSRLESAKEYLSHEAGGAAIEIRAAGEGDSKKADAGLPGRPAIEIEQ